VKPTVTFVWCVTDTTQRHIIAMCWVLSK